VTVATSDARVMVSAMDPRAAAAEALRAYLRNQRFTVWSPTGEERDFELMDVFPEWPRPDRELPYPSASIIDAAATPMASNQLTPQVLEDTFNQYRSGSVLWKLAEAECVFQVDFWCNTVADREAIAAALPGLFAPGETATNVRLQGPAEYWSLPVRAQLESYERADSAGAIWANERRLRTRIRCEVDVVELRCANLLAVTADVRDLEA